MTDYYQQNIQLNIGHNAISSLHTIQYDTAREFHFYIDDYMIPTDAEIRIYVKKPSGKEVYNPCLLSDEEIIVYPTTQMFAECGLNIGQIQIVKENKMLTSFLFHVIVHESCPENAILSTNEFTILDSLIVEAREIAAAEASRIEAENLRIEYESDRITNENNRINAENLRQQAEQLRQQNTNAAIDNCETARQNANIAADHSNNAAQNANESAANANIATQYANEAAVNANNAAQSANSAAANARNISEHLTEQAENGIFSSTISNVSAVTGEPGTEASVQNIGTAKDANLVFTIPKGETGEPFSIKKVYASIDEMNASFASDGLSKGQFVLINTENVEDEDNAKLYVKRETEYVYITDLSGAMGTRGSIWNHGTAITGTNQEGTIYPDSEIPISLVNDSYLNVVTGNTYRCISPGNPTEAKWVYTGNIKGESGNTDENSMISFTTADTRENISSPESLKTLFGKIAKWFSDLKSIAFSGSYNDLSDKPTIPSVGNGKITITQNGTSKGSFTTNQSGDTTIALTDTNTHTLTGVKGNAESTYRTGNVNITPANIGAIPSGNISNNLTTTAASHVLDARQGKALNDKITSLNNNLSNSLRFKGSIPSTNLDSITTPGIYSVDGHNLAISSVSGGANGAYKSGTYKLWGSFISLPYYNIQVLITPNFWEGSGLPCLAIRFYMGNPAAWTSWMVVF